MPCEGKREEQKDTLSTTMTFLSLTQQKGTQFFWFFLWIYSISKQPFILRRWFLSSDNGLGSSTKTKRSSEAALWLRSLNPRAQSGVHTQDLTVLHQLCDLWHCNTMNNIHTHTSAAQACAQASAHWGRAGTNTCARSHSAALLKRSTKPELDVVSPNLFDTTVVLLSSRKSA